VSALCFCRALRRGPAGACSPRGRHARLLSARDAHAAKTRWARGARGQRCISGGSSALAGAASQSGDQRKQHADRAGAEQPHGSASAQPDAAGRARPRGRV
jgi:hypothetical protein